MSFTAIDLNAIKVGDPITKELLNSIKYNFDDLDERITSIASSGGTVYILNGDFSLVGFSSTQQDIFYYKAKQDFSINEFSVQLFTKQGVASGNLVLDLQKSSNTNDANFSSILSSSLSFNFSTDADYLFKSALIDSGLNGILSGNIIRIKVTGVPAGFYGKILINIGAQ
jgi:hypothetical protein